MSRSGPRRRQRLGDLLERGPGHRLSRSRRVGGGDRVVSAASARNRLTLGGAPISREIGPGTAFTLPPVAIHRVLHTGDRPAVTIHAYSPPLRRPGRTGSPRTAHSSASRSTSRSSSAASRRRLTPRELVNLPPAGNQPHRLASAPVYRQVTHDGVDEWWRSRSRSRSAWTGRRWRSRCARPATTRSWRSASSTARG